jgi:hypothetical protein
MRKIGIGLLLSVAAAWPWGQTVAGKAAPRARTELTCAWPVGPHDSARVLLRRFGRQARMADIGIGEGETQRGVEIFFGDPHRRMAVLFWDSARRHPEKVQFWHEQSPWTVAGIRPGDSLESVQRRNGRAFTLQQFGADYGGTLGSFEQGRLATQMGPCEPFIIFDYNPEKDAPEGITGDGPMSSDLPGMEKGHVTVGALGVRFAPPPEM